MWTLSKDSGELLGFYPTANEARLAAEQFRDTFDANPAEIAPGVCIHNMIDVIEELESSGYTLDTESPLNTEVLQFIWSNRRKVKPCRVCKDDFFSCHGQSVCMKCS